jgi:hypothetical protein
MLIMITGQTNRWSTSKTFDECWAFTMRAEVPGEVLCHPRTVECACSGPLRTSVAAKKNVVGPGDARFFGIRPAPW